MSYRRDDELPLAVRRTLPLHARELYRAGFNSAWEQRPEGHAGRSGGTSPRLRRRKAAVGCRAWAICAQHGGALAGCARVENPLGVECEVCIGANEPSVLAIGNNDQQAIIAGHRWIPGRCYIVHPITFHVGMIGGLTSLNRRQRCAR